MKTNLFLKTFVTTCIAIIFFQEITYAQCSELIFNDEFNGSSVDLTKWSFDNGDGCPTLCGWGNVEEQWYRPENTTVQNGNLIITTRNESFGGKQYTSSKLITSGKFNARYGRYEARIKLPSAGGIWPAFWMLPESNNWPFTGEIDIMEAQHSNPESIGGTVHYNNGGHQFNGREYDAGLDLSEGFHEYAVEWEPTEIRWYVDNQLYHTVTPSNTVDPWPFDQGDWYLILNVAVGGPGTPYTGFIPPTPSDYPTQMEVDYVRVYSGTFNTQLIGDNTVYVGDENKIYSISPIDGASYVWSVPTSATIISGQGTNSIEVNWGTSGGDVAVSVNVPDCGISDYKMTVTVEPPRTLDFLFEDFETNRNLVYGNTTSGVLTEAINNPAINNTNNSSLVGRYQRDAGSQYDVLFMESSNIGNALDFVSGKKSVWIDVYTDAPIGTEFILQLENGNLSSGDWPMGRHSRYVAKTTTQNQWETLEFELLDRPDTNVGALEVNQFALLIDANSNTNHIAYFDNVRSMIAAEVAVIDEVIITDYDGINQLTPIFQNGVYTANVSNPAVNDVNSSSSVGRYIRDASSQYDVVSFSTSVITDSNPFKEGDQIFFMDVYTAAAVGTEITISLENQIASENDFPLGRNSQYIGVVSQQNTWHTIAFTHASSPDSGTSNLSIDEISILFDPNSNASDTYYFDNFKYGITSLPVSYVFSEMIQDYNGNDHLAFDARSTGVYQAPAGNPQENEINSSTQVGRYVRNDAELYDVLFFETNFINDASLYASEDKRFAMDLYTDAPVGTVISWQLEASSAATSSNYPIGRHSVYQATVKEQNAWHTLEFILTATPDLVINDAQIDNVVLLFDPNNQSNHTFYIDNLRSLQKEDTVQLPVLSSIIVSSDITEINQGETVQFQAQGFDQNGASFQTNFDWMVTGGSINANGLYTGSDIGTYTISASSGAVSGTSSITVKENTTSFYTIPGIIEAEDYKEGGEGVGYHDLTAGNTGGAYRQEDVDIENTGDVLGGFYNVGWIRASEWLAYDINALASSSNYDIDFRVASPNGNGKFHLELDGVTITDVISVPNTGSWQQYETISVNNISITEGNHELRIVFDANGLNINYLEFKESEVDTIDNCSGLAANNQYSYEISSDTANSTITFIPEVTGVGDNVCILYYSVNTTGPYPGYLVTPNVPFEINASTGEEIFFYYTYSLPTGGENNTASNRHDFIVGACEQNRVSEIQDTLEDVIIYPNPILDHVQVLLDKGHKYWKYELIDISGKVVKDKIIDAMDSKVEVDMSKNETGIYFLKLSSGIETRSFKLLKK
ncbi:family 16 glycosylhydrolase [Aquimarina litoralis]|uniref:family 16 glycosylhydrolase n=1 Tax=Aquimarina litoralis TaxID=584605 RepID=UPI001C55BC59|nr:family 16 glycosylhydrolase [Aquimarina litoralis]MBW1296656.1 family 16 glycosylhydrolase [Aquimarina litoralis]